MSFTFFAAFCFICVVVYVWMKRNESFLVKLACSLVFGATAYVLAVGLGFVVGPHMPSKWLVEHIDLAVLYQENEKPVLLENVLLDGSPCLHFKHSAKQESEFVVRDGNVTVHEENGLAILRIHHHEFVDWGYWLAWLAATEPQKYDFIVPKDKRKNVSDN